MPILINSSCISKLYFKSFQISSRINAHKDSLLIKNRSIVGANKKLPKSLGSFRQVIIYMRMARLELAQREPHAPQACVSTNSTTSACLVKPELQ